MLNDVPTATQERSALRVGTCRSCLIIYEHFRLGGWQSVKNTGWRCHVPLHPTSNSAPPTRLCD